jgi:hypothetical protein
VLRALVDGGLDDLAAEVEAKLPPGCFGSEYCAWPKLGARALIGGAFRFVTALLRPHGDRVVNDWDIAAETKARLRGLGQDITAAVFEREFNLPLGYDEREEPNEDYDGEDVNEGWRLAMKLRECSVLAE